MQRLEGRLSDESFQNESIRNFSGTFQLEAGQIIPVQLAIHPNISRRIAINVPGILDNIHGYADKYKKVAAHMEAEGLTAVIRTAGWNPSVEDSPDITVKAALEYAREHAWEISGDPKPEVMLMGFSSGASAIAGIAHLFPEVTKILLLAPSGDMGEEVIREGLMRFHGEVYIVVGAQDEVVGPQAGRVFSDMATGAAHKELFIIPECGHQFRGEANERIMSEAPFYAFSTGQKPQFPNPQGEIKLYG